MSFELRLGDCHEVLAELPDASVDAVVTDPPYGLSSEPDIVEVLTHWLAGDRYEHGSRGFMGKTWDSFVPGPEYWRECLRVLKPGGHLLAFASTRTSDLMGIAIRMGGFEIRDSLLWLYGTGFPKSLNIGDGRGTALKPAHEPIVMARKPLVGTVAANVSAHGTGALNIDACRIEGAKPDTTRGAGGQHGRYNALPAQGRVVDDGAGRWPANVILDEEAAAMLDEQSGTLKSPASYTRGADASGGILGKSKPAGYEMPGYGDSGGASRFFYVAKASRSERDRGCEHLPARSAGEATDREDGSDGLSSPRAGAGRTGGARNHHPTVKPVQLMRYLVRMVTPKGGVVLDPFMGSGTTGVACMAEWLRFIGIEQSAEYIAIAEARINHAVAQRGLFTENP